MLFIDFKKAFDSIHRGILMKILRAYGLPEAIVALIQKMYSGTLAKVITSDGLLMSSESLLEYFRGTR